MRNILVISCLFSRCSSPLPRLLLLRREEPCPKRRGEKWANGPFYASHLSQPPTFKHTGYGSVRPVDLFSVRGSRRPRSGHTEPTEEEEKTVSLALARWDVHIARQSFVT